MSEVMTLATRAREAARGLGNDVDRAAQPSAAGDGARADAPSGRDHSPPTRRTWTTARAKNVAPALLDRLELSPARLKSMSEALKALSLLQDPVGEVVEGHTLPNGIKLQQVRVPLGVVAMIYEARPNVTADAAGLCIKTGNAVILRGGSLAVNSNMALTRVLANAAVATGMPEGSIQIIESTEREAAEELMGLHGYIDVLIPRGGAG